MDQLIAFHGIFGSCVLRPPQKDYFFAVPWRGSFGRILTMQLEPPKAWGELKRGFEVLAPSEMCFQGMGAVEKEI